jgi:hypothetical protein
MNIGDGVRGVAAQLDRRGAGAAPQQETGGKTSDTKD